MSDTASVPPMIRQAQLIQQIANTVVAAVAVPWTHITYSARRTTTYSESATHVTLPNGEVASQSSPRGLGRVVRELRDWMSRAGTGTWFTMWIDIDEDGRVSSRFDYDTEPEWDEPVNPLAYFDDLREYRRDPEHIPEWLAQQVALGKAEFLRGGAPPVGRLSQEEARALNEERSELIQRIAFAMVAAAGDEWSAVWFEVHAVHGQVELVTTLVDGPGQEEQGIPAKQEWVEWATRLRAVMYQPDRGCWFNATIIVNRDERIDAVFDFDDEPRWTTPADPALYRDELEAFPRSDDEIPEWLAAKLAEADRAA